MYQQKYLLPDWVMPHLSQFNQTTGHLDTYLPTILGNLPLPDCCANGTSLRSPDPSAQICFHAEGR